MLSEPRTKTIQGFEVTVDHQLGHIAVEHDGHITWDELQSIKNKVWGIHVRAAEYYPAQTDVVNTRNCRHLWRLGISDFSPDLIGVEPNDSLIVRYVQAWSKPWSQGA